MALVGTAFFRTIVSTEGKQSQFPYRTKIYYSKIDGIQEGTEVTVKGIYAGYILSIDVVPANTVLDRKFLDPAKETAIELTLAMKQPITLWDNYQIRFKSKTIFSSRIIDIDPGSYGEDSERQFEPVYLADSILPSAFPSARYIDNFFDATNTMITENRSDIRSIVANSKDITEKLRNDQGTLPRLIQLDDTYLELERTILAMSILQKEGRRYVESTRKMENTHPMPFFIASAFFGRRTLAGRPQEPISALRNIRNFP